MYDALRTHRMDPVAFEYSVLQRIESADRKSRENSVVVFAPLLRVAAAYFPVSLMAGCKSTATAASLAPASGVYKFLGLLAFPAISIFVLLSSAIFSIAKIRSIQNANGEGLDKEQSTTLWWRQHKWRVYSVFALSLVAAFVGATAILFWVYLFSFG